MKTNDTRFMLVCAILGLGGCNDYGASVVQNLSWGVPGLVAGGFAGVLEWVIGALVNAAFN